MGGLLAALLGTLVVSGAFGAPPSTPTFVQSVSAHKSSVRRLTLVPAANITAGNRPIVEVGVWSSRGATAASVTDSAGNAYTEVLHFKASDDTEMSVWSAPVTAGGATRPTITVKPSSSADGSYVKQKSQAGFRGGFESRTICPRVRRTSANATTTEVPPKS